MSEPDWPRAYDTPMREQSLREYVMDNLPPEHRAHQEFREVRRVLQDALAALTTRYDANIGATLIADLKQVLDRYA